MVIWCGRGGRGSVVEGFLRRDGKMDTDRICYFYDASTGLSRPSSLGFVKHKQNLISYIQNY
jgi:hypothetical protein